MTNWKLKFIQLSGETSRSSFSIELSGRSDKNFDLNYRTAQHKRAKAWKCWLMEAETRKEAAEITDRHFVHKTSGMSNEQLKGFAVVGMTGKWRAEKNSKEWFEVGQNNSSLTLETTSVATSEMGTNPQG